MDYPCNDIFILLPVERVVFPKGICVVFQERKVGALPEDGIFNGEQFVGTAQFEITRDIACGSIKFAGDSIASATTSRTMKSSKKWNRTMKARIFRMV